MKCRLCASGYTVEVVDFGDLSFTGTFPSSPDEPQDRGRLALMVCDDCGLVQLADSYPAEKLYGDNYGYRSGLNASMVQHLSRTARRLERMVDLRGGTVLDIGSNDGTMLGAYQTKSVRRIGIDPTSAKFAEFYKPNILAVDRFFDEDVFWEVSQFPARLVTSMAMFYDLEDPVEFARNVYRVLESDGLWHIEVADANFMRRTGAYDTICHEHLEYYSLTTLSRILTDAGFKIVSASTNSTNGGSLAVTAAKAGSHHRPDTTFVPWMLAVEARQRVNKVDGWLAFADRVKEKQSDLLGLLSALRVDGKSVMGLGASTKGNVLLQSSGIGTQMVEMIGDVNPYKFGRVTPGTGIPIVSESQVLAESPDYLLVLPWHFRDGLVRNLADYLDAGGKLIFPLPDIEVVGY